MSKLIRFDEDRFGYLVDVDLTMETVHRMAVAFKEEWPGKKLIVMQADEFIDLTGQYEIVPIPSRPAPNKPEAKGPPVLDLMALLRRWLQP